jgi:hypothetical protein
MEVKLGDKVWIVSERGEPWQVIVVSKQTTEWFDGCPNHVDYLVVHVDGLTEVLDEGGLFQTREDAIMAYNQEFANPNETET